VGDLLREEGFSLQGNAKTLEGKQHPDRDAQFRYINEHASQYQDTGDPVISVDTKKKELVGPFGNPGREWRPKGSPRQVSTHDFPDRQLGKAVPYGIYDVAAKHRLGQCGCRSRHGRVRRGCRCAAGGTGPGDPSTRRRAGCW
jgi:hypothetical protein